MFASCQLLCPYFAPPTLPATLPKRASRIVSSVPVCAAARWCLRANVGDTFTRSANKAERDQAGIASKPHDLIAELALGVC
jgi:hypothetical protein